MPPCTTPSSQLCDVTATVADARVVTAPSGHTCVQYTVVVSLLGDVCAKMLNVCGVASNHRGDVRCFAVHREYHEFRALQAAIEAEFPKMEGCPSLPGRTLLRSQDPKFISDRRSGLRTCVTCGAWPMTCGLLPVAYGWGRGWRFFLVWLPPYF